MIKKILFTICFCLMAQYSFGAELLIKVGDNPNPRGFKDGDIIHAFNNRDIKKVHAQHIVHVDKMPRNSDGNLKSGCLLDMYYQKVAELKIKRTSKNEVLITNLWTGETEIRNSTTLRTMAVEQFFNRRINHPARKVFGVKGFEYVYGGGTKIDESTIDDVWIGIEARTLNRKSNHDKFPWTDKELSKYLVLNVDDFTDKQKAKYTELDLDIDGTIIKKRKVKVNYKNIGLKQSDITNGENKNKKVDLRDSSPMPLSIITAKP